MIRRTKRRTPHLYVHLQQNQHNPTSRPPASSQLESAILEAIHWLLSCLASYIVSNGVSARLERLEKEVGESKQRDLETSLASYSVTLLSFTDTAPPLLRDTLGRGSVAGAQLLYL